MGKEMKTVADFIFLCSKITADGDCRHEIKRHLLLGRKAVTNIDSILKSRDISLLTKLVQPWTDVRAGPYKRPSAEELRCCSTSKF